MCSNREQGFLQFSMSWISQDSFSCRIPGDCRKCRCQVSHPECCSCAYGHLPSLWITLAASLEQTEQCPLTCVQSCPTDWSLSYRSMGHCYLFGKEHVQRRRLSVGAINVSIVTIRQTKEQRVLGEDERRHFSLGHRYQIDFCGI